MIQFLECLLEVFLVRIQALIPPPPPQQGVGDPVTTFHSFSRLNVSCFVLCCLGLCLAEMVAMLVCHGRRDERSNRSRKILSGARFIQSTFRFFRFFRLLRLFLLFRSIHSIRSIVQFVGFLHLVHSVHSVHSVASFIPSFLRSFLPSFLPS